jgi:drug/metabolite transporter (DMT)-like permease
MWLLALVWGASYLFIKLAIEDMSPAFVVWARLALAALVLVPLAVRAGALDGLRSHAGPILLLSLIQVVAPFLLITYGEERIASSMTGILVASAPIFTALLALAGPVEHRVGSWSMGGILVGIVGVALLFGVDLTGDGRALVGGLMILVASLGYAAGALYFKRRVGGPAPLGVAAATMTTSALVLTPLATLSLPSSVPGGEALGSLLALGVGGTGLAFGIFYRLIADVGAAKASVVAYLAPGFALFYGAVLLDEPVTTGAVAGLALILAGSWLAAEGRPPWTRRHAVAAPVTA